MIAGDPPSWIFAVVVVLAVAWVCAHRAFWVEYHRVYPDRPSRYGIGL